MITNLQESEVRKNKGYEHQNDIIDRFLKKIPTLNEIDLISCPKSANGEDVRMTEAARVILPLSIECKHRDKGFKPTYDAYEQAHMQMKNLARVEDLMPIAFIKQGDCPPLAIISADDMIEILSLLRFGKEYSRGKEEYLV